MLSRSLSRFSSKSEPKVPKRPNTSKVACTGSFSKWNKTWVTNPAPNPTQKTIKQASRPAPAKIQMTKRKKKQAQVGKSA